MNKLADSVLVPGVFVDVDNSIANTLTAQPFKTVLFGQKLTTGTAAAEEFVRVRSLSDAQTKFGIGSMLARMFERWFAINTLSEVYAIPLADAAAAVAASEVISFSGPATAAGTVHLRIDGRYITVAVASGDADTTIATAVNAAINAETDLAVTSTVASDTVTVTARNAGALGGNIVIQRNPFDGNEAPAGTKVKPGGGPNGDDYVTLSGGATDPDVADALAALPDDVINVIAHPYNTGTGGSATVTELDRRWQNTVQMDGHFLTIYTGTVGAAVTFADYFNSGHMTCVDGGLEPMSVVQYDMAAVAARVAYSAEIDPARPFRTLEVTGAIPGIVSNRRTTSERQSLLAAGLGTMIVRSDESMAIDRLVTTYKTNANGAPDNSYRNTNTMFNLSYLRQSFKNKMLSLYPRHKLADTGDSFGAGQPIATPATIKGAIIALYEDWVLAGLVENVDAFADSLIVERDTVNRSRVNVLMQPILIGQLYQFDATLQFLI